MRNMYLFSNCQDSSTHKPLWWQITYKSVVQLSTGPAFRSDPLLVFWSDTSLAFSSDPLTLAGCCQGRGLLNPHGRVAGCRHSVLFVRAQLVQ